MVVGIIYKYISPSGKVYIGQTTEEKRRRKTFFNINKRYGGDKIDAARQKYGPENFTYEVLYRATFSNKKEATLKLDELEQFYITVYDSYENGYNMTYGGYTTRGFQFSPEQRKQISLRQIGRKLRPRSSEEKAALSALMKEKWASVEYRANRNDNSVEHRLKLSESLKGEKNGMYGKKHTAGTRMKMAESRFGEKNIWFGRKKDATYRNKISESLSKYRRNNPVDEETKSKISKSISVSIYQYSLQNEFIAQFASATIAGKEIGIDSSCIIKCCKGKRKTAGGYVWRYAEKPTFSAIETGTLDNNEWIDIAEAVRLTGRDRNVIYYHMKVHNVPFLKNGRKRKISKSALLSILK